MTMSWRPRSHNSMAKPHFNIVMMEEQPTAPGLMFWLAPEEQGYNLSNLPHYRLAEGQNLWRLRKRGGHGGHGLGGAELRRTAGSALREHVQRSCRLQHGGGGGHDGLGNRERGRLNRQLRVTRGSRRSPRIMSLARSTSILDLTLTDDIQATEFDKEE